MDLNFLLELLEHRAVRDLAWVIGSPSLMRSDDPEVLGARFFEAEIDALSPRLLALDKAPRDLLEHLEKRKSRRLGEYFEFLIEYWRRVLSENTILGQNIVIRDEAQTVGELDLLFRDGQTAFHWEVAVKFYIGLGPANGRTPEECWIGPNPNDRLDLKWRRFIDRQLALSSLDAAADELGALGIANPPRAQGILKGFLFEPIDATRSAPTPEALSPDVNRGWWVYESETRQLLERFGEANFVWLKRLEWLSPALASHHKDDVHPLSAFAKTLGGRRGPTLVALLDDDGREFSRGFVVPSEWPAEA